MGDKKSIRDGQTSHVNRWADVTNVNPTASGDSFQPLFVVVRDATTGEYHHPHVHYIFEDDEPELVTGAIIESVEQETASPSRMQNEERLVLINMSKDGRSVQSTRSLTSQWQPTHTTLASAPTFEQAPDASTMMTIEGQGIGHTQQPATPTAVSETIKGSNTFDRISSLTHKLEMLESEYHQNATTLRVLSQKAFDPA